MGVSIDEQRLPFTRFTALSPVLRDQISEIALGGTECRLLRSEGNASNIRMIIGSSFCIVLTSSVIVVDDSCIVLREQSSRNLIISVD